MTVYLLQTPRPKIRNIPVNLEPAKKYGKIIPVLHEDVNPCLNTSLVIGEMEKALADFNYRSDYILWVIGDPLTLMLAGAVLAKRGLPYYTWLRYCKRTDNRTNEVTSVFYQPTKVILAPDKNGSALVS